LVGPGICGIAAISEAAGIGVNGWRPRGRRKLLALASEETILVWLSEHSVRKGLAMAHKDEDLRKVKDLIEIMKENDLVEAEIRHGDDRIFLKRRIEEQPKYTPVPVALGTTTVATNAEPPGQVQKESEPAQEENLIKIKSPIVGTFYAQPSPDSEPFVEIGSQVTPRSIVCVIEAMKVMNEIKAETSGSIVDVLVSNGQAVEYGQPLFKVKPE